MVLKKGHRNCSQNAKNILISNSFFHVQIWVWHTRTVPPDESDFEAIDTKILHETNLGPLSNFW